MSVNPRFISSSWETPFTFNLVAVKLSKHWRTLSCLTKQSKWLCLNALQSLGWSRGPRSLLAEKEVWK